MPLPVIDAANRRKPIAYDPARDRYILFDEVVAGQERLLPVDQLSEEDLRKLVIARQRAGPDYTVQAMDGPPMSRDDVVRAIEGEEPFGRVTVQAERDYLRELQEQIAEALDS